MLNPIIDELFTAARREGRRESRDAYAFDALIELSRRHSGRVGASTSSERASAPVAVAPVPAGAPVSDDGAATVAAGTAAPVRGSALAASGNAGPGRRPERSVNPTHLALLRIDLEALVRGRVEGDELCDIAGFGPIPVRTARDLLGDSIVKLVITNGVDVANVTHLGRGPTVAQRIALLWSSPGCDVRGCSSTIGIQTDHRVPWSDDQVTELPNLDRLCSHHHYLKTRHGWALVVGTGKRPMVARGDPRHPANQGPTSACDDSSPPDEPDGSTHWDPRTQPEDTRPPPDPLHESSLFGDVA